MKYLNDIERAKNNDLLIKKGASLKDTIKLIQKISSRDKYQLKNLSQKLESNTIEQTAHNIWTWVKQNIPYKPDKREETKSDDVEELVRTPARIIEDAKNGIGSDCDCYTTFISAILKNLNIEHYYKVVAWEKPNEFSHIYPVAIDEQNREYAIDCIPEITHFNIELPFINHKKFSPMDLYELNGAIQLATEKEDIQDLKEELAASLNGYEDYDDDEYLSTPEIYQSLFGRLAVVDTPEEADYVLDGITFVDNVLAKQLKDAREALRKEFKNPSGLSKVQNTAKELAIIEDVIAYWQSPKREEVLKSAILDSDVYRQFYIELANGTQTTLSGANSVDLYLKYILDEDIKKYEALDGWLKSSVQKVGANLKKVGSKIGEGIKQTFKAVHRYNPATLTARAALMELLKMGAGILFIAAYAPVKYKSNAKVQAKAKKANLIIDKLTKLIAMKRNNFDKYVKQGIDRRFGSIEKAFDKIASGQLKGATESGELGAVVAVAGIIVKIWNFIKKLFKKQPQDPQLSTSDFDSRSGNVTTSPDNAAKNIPDDNDNYNYSENQTENINTMKTQTAELKNTTPTEKPSTGEKIKQFIITHKTKLIITVVSILLLVIGYVWWKNANSKKLALSGARRRKTRKSTKRKTSRSTHRRTRTRSKKPLKGAKIIVTRSTVRVKDNGARLKKMHRIAKRLRKEHPNAKYSSLLKRAAGMM